MSSITRALKFVIRIRTRSVAVRRDLLVRHLKKEYKCIPMRLCCT